MGLVKLKYFLQDIRYFKLLPKRYKSTKGMNEEYWRNVSRKYGNFKKRVSSSDYHWYVITFKDGRKELAYFKVWYGIIPHGGRLCRGRIWPRYWPVTQFEHTDKIELAF